MIHVAAATIVASIFLAASPQVRVDIPAPPQVRVDTDVAMAQIVTKVEPVVPEAAAKAKIGGVVIGDAVVRADGTVESVTILSGHQALHEAAAAAFKAWTFKPFSRGGRPVRVSVILEAKFPDPIREEAARLSDAHRAAFAECGRALEARLAASVAACEKLVSMSTQLPADRVLERSSALSALSQALLQHERPREALVPAEKALAMRLERGDNAGEDHFVLAVIHQRLGDRAASERAFRAAESSFEAAIEKSPRSADQLRSSLATIRRVHAAMLRDAGDAAGASALEAKIEAVDVPKPNPPPVLETLGTTQFIRPAAPPLTADDRRNLLKLIAADGGKPWLVIGEWWAENPTWLVRVLQEPYVSRHGFRRGRILRLWAKTAGDGSRIWTLMGNTKSGATYAQVGEFSPAGSLTGLDDPRRPILLEPTPAPALTDDDVIEIVRFVRSRAVKPGPGADRLLQSDVQPWPIASIANWSNGEVTVDLREGKTFPGRGQSIRLRRDGTTWTIREMFGARQ